MALTVTWFIVSMLCLAQATDPVSANWPSFWITLPATVAAVASFVGVIFGVINAQKTTVIAVKTEEMKKQGDGRWTEQQDALKAARKEIKELNDTMLKMTAASSVAAEEIPEKRSHHAKKD